MSLVNCFILPPKHPITRGYNYDPVLLTSFVQFKCQLLVFLQFLILLSQMFDSYGHAISTMQIIFFDSSSNVRSGLVAVFVVHIRCSRSQRSLYLFLWISLAFVQFSFHHFVSGRSMPLLITHQTANTFSALLCCRMYSVLANFLQPARKCCTVSFCFWHNRY